MINEKYIQIIENNYNTDSDLPHIIFLLKQAGASQIDTMAAIRRCVNIRIPDLDNLILNSPAWSHMKSTNLKLRDKFLDSDNE